MQAFIYYCFVYPLSRMPMKIVYLHGDLVYWLLKNVFQYKRKILNKNLCRSFPEKSKQEIEQLRTSYYRHMADLLAEGIKNLTISAEELKKRVKITNPEVINELYKQGKSVLLVSGHYNNWEFVITSIGLQFKHKAFGIGTPLTSPFWEKKATEKRERFGLKVIHAAQVKETFENNQNERMITLVLNDQCPTNLETAYWTDFLNQKTPFYFGAEYLAHQYNQSIVFYEMTRIKRGYYEITLHKIVDDASKFQFGEITEKHIRLLEQLIQKKPEYWLWSHNRWKRGIPSNLEEIMQKQKERFESRFPIN